MFDFSQPIPDAVVANAIERRMQHVTAECLKRQGHSCPSFPWSTGDLQAAMGIPVELVLAAVVSGKVAGLQVDAVTGGVVFSAVQLGDVVKAVLPE